MFNVLETNMEESKIKKALKRLEGAEVKIVCRGGEICKILAQTVKLSEKDGIITSYEIPADIIEGG